MTHAAVLELSASERSTDLLQFRLNRIGRLISQAADCEAPLVVGLIDDGRPQVIFEATLDSDLGTETARDNQIAKVTSGVLAEVKLALEPHTSLDTGDGSNPGIAFRFLAELLSRLDPGETIDAIILSDGITATRTTDLNRPLSDDDFDALAVQVAPMVDLEQRVAIDWQGLGLTTDPSGPPSAWLEDLIVLWTTACEIRRASSCLITNI